MLKSFVGCLISKVKYTSLCSKQNGFRALMIQRFTLVRNLSEWLGGLSLTVGRSSQLCIGYVGHTNNHSGPRPCYV